MRWVGLLRLALLCMLGVRRGKMRFGMDLLVLLVAVSVAQHT